MSSVTSMHAVMNCGVKVVELRLLFSERERQVRYMLSPVRPSVVCLSVTFVRPTQPVEIFGNVSSPFWYLGHPLSSTENFTEIAQGNHSVGGFKRKRGSQI